MRYYHQNVCSRKLEGQTVFSFSLRHTPSTSQFYSSQQLEFAREHTSLHRAPLFRSAQRLKLYRLKYCQLAQRIFFINSFRSLIQLYLDLDFRQLDYRDQIRPKSPRIQLCFASSYWGANTRDRSYVFVVGEAH